MCIIFYFSVLNVEASSEIKLFSNLKNGMVKTGSSITLTCDLGTYTEHVYWVKKTGSLEVPIIKSDVIESFIENTDRYVFYQATRNGDKQAQLIIEGM